MYDFFGYLEAKHGMRWDYLPPENSGDISPLAHYRIWCDKGGNKERYLNQKVRTVQRFYQWAHRTGQIEDVPYIEKSDSGHSIQSVSGQTATRIRRGLSTDQTVREPQEVIEVLSRRQIEVVLDEATNPTLNAALLLGLTGGLRAEELLTFPHFYVRDCRKLSEQVRTIPVYLNPADMDTKNNKPRKVWLSVQCMNRLWQYKESSRRGLERRAEKTSSELFLTRFGIPYVADGLVAPMARLSVRLGFHVHPHMLRHTFATHTLASLESLRAKGLLKTSPIVLLRDLLGHSSIKVTERYLHYLEAIDDAFGTKYQAEIDQLALRYLKAPAVSGAA